MTREEYDHATIELRLQTAWERIEIVVIPEWKHRALEIATESAADNLITELMTEPAIRKHGDAAASYGKTLQQERQALSVMLSPQREYEALTMATWLIEREFDTPVSVVPAEEADVSLAHAAEPGRPAIDIVE